MRTLSLAGCAVVSALSAYTAGCASTPVADSPSAAEKPAAAAPSGPITFDDFTAASFSDYTPVSLVLHLSGKLASGVDGNQLEWSMKSDVGAMGSGSVPVEIAGDRTFKAALPVTFAKTVADLDPYEKTEDLDLSIDVKIGGTSATAIGHMRSPHLPQAKILTVQATRSGVNTIELTYNFAVNNPNLYPLTWSGFDYKAVLAGNTVAETPIPNSSAELKQSAQTEFGLNHEANADNCPKDIKNMVKQTKLPWGFTGVVHYPNIDVPFTLSGELSLAKE